MTKTHRPHKRATQEQPTCQRCKAIRVFLMSVLALALVQILSPGTLAMLRGIEPLAMSLIFVGGLALMAIAKAVFEVWLLRKSTQQDATLPVAHQPESE
jgi:hypothetical protein